MKAHRPSFPLLPSVQTVSRRASPIKHAHETQTLQNPSCHSAARISSAFRIAWSTRGQSLVGQRTAASQRSSGWMRVRLWIHKFQLFPSIHNSAVLPLCEQDRLAAVSGERSQRSRSLLNIPYRSRQQDSCEAVKPVLAVPWHHKRDLTLSKLHQVFHPVVIPSIRRCALASLADALSGVGPL